MSENYKKPPSSGSERSRKPEQDKHNRVVSNARLATKPSTVKAAPASTKVRVSQAEAKPSPARLSDTPKIYSKISKNSSVSQKQAKDASVASSTEDSMSNMSSNLSLSSSSVDSSLPPETVLKTSSTAVLPSPFQLPSTPARVAFSSSTSLGLSVRQGRQLDATPTGTPVRRTHLQRRSDMARYPSTPEHFTNVQIETPRSCRRASVTPRVGSAEAESSLLTVAVRVRPLSSKETNDPEIVPVLTVRDNEVLISSEYGQNYSFVYDHCFDSSAKASESATQVCVYRTLAQNLLVKTFQGFNTCLFAYGQTGSGKSYSIMGAESSDIDLVAGSQRLSPGAGIIPRFCLELFDNVSQVLDGNRSLIPLGEPAPTQVAVEMSYFEIYKEKIHDLLLCGTEQNVKRPTLKVREHPVFGPYVVNLTTNVVKSYQEMQSWLQLGNNRRVTAATGANERSSRSHSVLTITLTQSHEEFVDNEAHTLRRESKINIVDLAGSERVAQVNSTGERRQEGVQINQSLLTLGRVIQALADISAGKKNVFVPYRESVLTWLLKESLGGNSRTAMLATVSPASCHTEDTLSTLRYACQARTIMNVARINEDPSAKLIRQLRAELEQYRRMHGTQAHVGWSVAVETVVKAEPAVGGSCNDLIEQQELELKAQIRELKLKLEKAEQEKLKERAQAKSWEEKLAETEQRRQQEVEEQRAAGISHRIDSRFPCLVALASDPSLSNSLFYVLKEGSTRVGSVKSTKSDGLHTVVLEGALIQPTHCVILNSNNTRLFLSPSAEGETYVNGHLVKKEIALHHDDRLVLGPSHFFRVHHPKDPEAPKQSSNIDCNYQFVYEELYRIQNERLQTDAELAKAELLRQKELYEQYIRDLEGRIDAQHLEFDQFIREKTKITVESKAYSPVHMEPLPDSFLQKLREEPEPSIPVFELSRMINEANAICRKIKQPYEFSYSDVAPELLKRAVRVVDKENKMTMLLNLERFRKMLRTLKDLAEGDGSFQELFSLGDVWEPEPEAVGVKPENPYGFWECSFSVLDDTLNLTLDESISMDTSSRRRSLNASPQIYASLRGKASSSPTHSNIALAKASRESLQKLSPQKSLLLSLTAQLRDLTQTVRNLHQVWQPSALPGVLVVKDDHGAVAFGLSQATAAIYWMLPVWVRQASQEQPTYADREELPESTLRQFVTSSETVVTRLQNAVIFILQGLEFQKASFAEDWARKTEVILKEIAQLMGSVLVTFDHVESSLENLLNPTFGSFFASSLILGYEESYNSFHQALIEKGDELRSFIISLPDQSSASESQDSSNSSLHSSVLTNHNTFSLLIKACYDCISHTLNVIENCHPVFVKTPADWENTDFCGQCLPVWRSNLILLRQIWCLVEKTALIAEALSQEQADFLNFKRTATSLENLIHSYVEATAAATASSPDIENYLADLAFATNCVCKLTAEHLRAVALKKGRPITYNPIPAALLASPSRHQRPNPFGADAETGEPNSLRTTNSFMESDEEEDESFDIVPVALFDPDAVPQKSSLKSSSGFTSLKSVRFSSSTEDS